METLSHLFGTLKKHTSASLSESPPSLESRWLTVGRSDWQTDSHSVLSADKTGFINRKTWHRLEKHRHPCPRLPLQGHAAGKQIRVHRQSAPPGKPWKPLDVNSFRLCAASRKTIPYRSVVPWPAASLGSGTWKEIIHNHCFRENQFNR